MFVMLLMTASGVCDAIIASACATLITGLGAASKDAQAESSADEVAIAQICQRMGVPSPCDSAKLLLFNLG
jgi:hypothetical protein